jgi:hypothetical protein
MLRRGKDVSCVAMSCSHEPGAQEACHRESLRCPRLGGGSGQELLRALAHERRGTPLSSLHQSIRAPGLRQEVSAKFVGNPCRQETVSRTSYCNVRQHFVLSNPPFLQGLLQECPIFKDFSWHRCCSLHGPCQRLSVRGPELRVSSSF